MGIRASSRRTHHEALSPFNGEIDGSPRLLFKQNRADQNGRLEAEEGDQELHAIVRLLNRVAKVRTGFAEGSRQNFG